MRDCETFGTFEIMHNLAVYPSYFNINILNLIIMVKKVLGKTSQSNASSTLLSKIGRSAEPPKKVD